MAHTIIVYSDSGRRDSLRRSTTIAFTLAPANSGPATTTYDPVVYEVMEFRQGCSCEMRFTWEPNPKSFSFGIYTMQSGNTIAIDDGSPDVPAGKCVRMATPRKGRGERWSLSSYDDTAMLAQSSVIAINDTDSSQNLALRIKHSEKPLYRSIVAYCAVGNEERIVAPSSLVLQGFEIHESGNLDNRVLLAADRRQPVFDFPVDGSSHPALSTWRLCEDPQGTIRLTPQNDGRPMVTLNPTETKIAELASSIAGMKGELSGMQNSIVDQQQRLVNAENATTRHQDEVLKSRKQLTTTRDLLSSVECRIPDLETKATRLEDTLGYTKTRVGLVERSLGRLQDAITSAQRVMARVHEQLPLVEDTSVQTEARMEAVTSSIARTQGKVVDLDKKTSRAERTGIKLEDSLTRIREDLSCVQESNMEDELPRLVHWTDTLETQVNALVETASQIDVNWSSWTPPKEPPQAQLNPSRCIVM